MTNPTDTNQASEDEMRKRLEKAGLYDLLTSIHESHEEDDCFCTTEIAPYYRQLLELIRTEKLKLLTEVRERVVGEYSKYPGHYTLSDVLHDQRVALTQLEAEL